MVERIWWHNNGDKYLALKLGEVEERCDIIYYHNGFWHRTTVPHEDVEERTIDFSKELMESRKQNISSWFRWELP